MHRTHRSSSRIVALVVAAAFVSGPLPAHAAPSAAGKPTYKASDPQAVFLWVDHDGWHLRTIAGDKQHNVRGVLRGKGFAELSVTRKALGPKVQLSDDTLRFDFDVFPGAVDGFDWKGPCACISIEMRVNNLTPKPGRVKVGARGEAVNLFPGDICP